MNLLLFTAADRLGDESLIITDQRLRHLLEVHRAKVGDSIRVGEVAGLMGAGEITELDSNRAIIKFSLPQAPPPKLPLTLVLALPRPKMLRRILRSVAELGIKELHVINSYRVEKSYWQSPVLRAEPVRDYLLAGLEQARDTQLPIVSYHKRFKPFAEDVLPSLITGRRALLAHPGDFPPCPGTSEEATLLVVGPEGGFIPYEVQKLQEAGCAAVSLGPRILRVENAINVLTGRLFSFVDADVNR